MIWDPTSLRRSQLIGRGGIQSFGFNGGNYKSLEIGCNPNEPQMEHDANETDVILTECHQL
jgi:hypothetical protein